MTLLEKKDSDFRIVKKKSFLFGWTFVCEKRVKNKWKKFDFTFTYPAAERAIEEEMTSIDGEIVKEFYVDRSGKT